VNPRERLIVPQLAKPFCENVGLANFDHALTIVHREDLFKGGESPAFRQKKAKGWGTRHGFYGQPVISKPEKSHALQRRNCNTDTKMNMYQRNPLIHQTQKILNASEMMNKQSIVQKPVVCLLEFIR